MRKVLSIAFVVCAACGVLFARPGMQSTPAASAPQEESKQKEINLKADLAGPVTPGDSVYFFVGNFAAQHNGAVITCDSAVRYTPDHVEFFGNVLINKNTTYVYGDRADYDGLLNEARVYSDIVKVVDGDATLYTYEFVFNTKTNIGTFGGGGVLYNRDNLVEADHGFYNSDTKELTCVEGVQMRNDEYQMKGDSVIYNVDTDQAWYFEHTNIWNKDGDYLYADRGEYQKKDTLYKVTRNGYILTEKQELWSDSIDYFRPKEHVILRGDVQIDDTEHKTLAFGEYGEYWKNPGNALLTRRPSMVSYDPQQPDTLYMRADSMFLYTLLTRDVEAAVEAEKAAKAAADSLAGKKPASKKKNLEKSQSGQPNSTPTSDETSTSDQTPLPIDSVKMHEAADSTATSTTVASQEEKAPEQELTPAEKKAKLREAALKAKAEQKAEAEKIRNAKLDTIAERRQAKITTRLLAEKAREERALEARRAKAEARLHKRQDRALRKGKAMPDSTELNHYDSLLAGNALMQDSLAKIMADTLQQDTSALSKIPADSVDSLRNPADSIYRLVKAYRNVRTFRTDFQSVCDSLVGISRDSTIHLYINPVLWNEANQITSDVMDIFTKNQEIVRAEFVGKPMMVSEIDTLHYNQVSGKKMEAFFRDNHIYRNDVNGNAQTIYYMQEEGDPDVKGMMVINSGSITFFINPESKIEKITYRTDVDWTAYPMDKIPPEVALFLKDFKWEGARRPTREDVFDRKIRPTERRERSELEYPDFPLVERLEQDKTRFRERGWSDRNDLILPEIDEWMRSLGFPTGQPRKQGTRL